MNEIFVKNSLYDSVMAHDKIYSLMYSPSISEYSPLEKQIIEVETSKLKWAQNMQVFYYIWGMPGPDFNRYTSETYGKGWAFTREEIINAWEK